MNGQTDRQQVMVTSVLAMATGQPSGTLIVHALASVSPRPSQQDRCGRIGAARVRTWLGAAR
jgi:hypothetical protein